MLEGLRYKMKMTEPRGEAENSSDQTLIVQASIETYILRTKFS